MSEAAVATKQNSAFSFDEYSDIIKAYKPIIRDFADVENEADESRGFCLIRHDIEFSLPRSLQMAEIDADHDIPSSFFVQVKNGAYNPLAPLNQKIIRQMHALGRHVGLHFYVTDLSADDTEEVVRQLEFQTLVLEEALGAKVDRFSYHRPPLWALKLGLRRRTKLINTYDPKFFELTSDGSPPQHIKYMADSQHAWKYGHPLPLCDSHQKVQLLMHPDEWSKDGSDPKRNFRELIDLHREEFIQTIQTECITTSNSISPRMKYKTTVFGNKTTTADLIRHLRKEGHTIDLIVTLSSEGKAGHDISGADDVETLARALGIAVYATSDYRLKTEADKKFFAENEFGIGLCTGWQRLLPAHVLSAFSSGVFGFHGSCWPFPDGRGRSPLNWSMRKGGDKVYHNCFKYVAAADAGEVFNTTEFPISAHDSISSVQFKALLDMKRVSHRLLTQYAAGDIKTTPQKDGATIVLEKLTPQDGLINFAKMPRSEILQLINATSRPFPGAFAKTAAGDILRIWRAVDFEFPDLETAVPGQVIDASLGQALIACKEGFLLCTDHEFSPAHKDTTLSSDLRFA